MNYNEFESTLKLFNDNGLLISGDGESNDVTLRAFNKMIFIRYLKRKMPELKERLKKTTKLMEERQNNK